MVVASKKRTRTIKIGPKDHGRRMSLDDFTRAVTTDERVYELDKGVIVVSDVPKLKHGQVVRMLRLAISKYESDHEGIINYSGSGSEAKVLIGSEESERHPDWLIYLRKPTTTSQQPWSEWIPEIVIEVVSESSVSRDYEDKPPEYAALGIMEYWIIDPLRQTITIKTRWRGLWKDRILKPGQSYATQLLPGFKLDARKILAAGK